MAPLALTDTVTIDVQDSRLILNAVISGAGGITKNGTGVTIAFVKGTTLNALGSIGAGWAPGKSRRHSISTRQRLIPIVAESTTSWGSAAPPSFTFAPLNGCGSKVRGRHGFRLTPGRFL